MASGKSSETVAAASKDAPSRPWWRPASLAALVGCVALFIVVVLALGLGLGLGLGLKRHSDKSTGANTNNSSTPTPPLTTNNPALGNESWRLPASEYVLDIASWDFNAPPTTRVYNFTLSEIEAFPDGKWDPIP
jgi:hypothetical protein